ncbi:hypothetical protein [Methylacidiphilum caldifontis]|nr:hypothetical protein [Methylacidiphilum caldifontis]
MTIWQPCERPQVGITGSGANRMVSGMPIYSTLPSRPYMVVGFIDAGNGLFGSPRTRAVSMAKKVGADALIFMSSD